MGLNRDLLLDKNFELQWRDECILIALCYNSVTKIVQENIYREYKISRSSFYRRIKKLEEMGIVHKNEKSPFSEYYIDPLYKGSNPTLLRVSQGLSPTFESPSKFPSFDEKIIRSHNYLFLCPIEHKPGKLNILLEKDNWLETVRMINWEYHYGHLGLKGIQAYVQFNPKTVNIRILQVFGRDPHEDDQEANRQCMEIKAYLEDRYPRLRLGPGKYLTKARNTGKHHGWVHHHLALKAKQQNLSLEKQYWGLDSSRDKPELDAYDRLRASEHIEKELEDFDFRSKYGIYFKDHDQQITETSKILEKTSQIQLDIVKQNNWLMTGQQTLTQITLGILERNAHLEKDMVRHNRLKEFFLKLRDMVRHKGYGKTE